MRAASARLARVLLALGAAAGYLASPLAALMPVAFVAAAENDGLGAGGASFAYNYVFGVSLVLTFILGYAIRDVLHRRSLRPRPAKPRVAAPPRT